VRPFRWTSPVTWDQMRRLAKFGASWILIAVGTTGTLVSQDGRRVIIHDPKDCPHCRLQLRRLASFSLPDSVRLAPIPHLLSFEETKLGQYLVGPDTTGAQFYLLSRDGHLLQRIGHRGRAAGKFGLVTRIASCGAAESSICVLDKMRRRVTVFSPRLALQDTIALPGSFDDVVSLKDGRLVAAGFIHTRESVGFPLHLTSVPGTLMRSFGSNDQHYGPGDRLSDLRTLAPRRPDGWWSSWLAAYVVEGWTVDGRRDLLIERKTSSFVADTSPLVQREDVSRPRHLVLGIRGDEAGLLWVTVRVEDVRWKAARMKVGSHSVPLPLEQLNGYLDTIIELIDPVKGRLVGRVRHPLLLVPSRGSRRWFGVTRERNQSVLEVFSAAAAETP